MCSISCMQIQCVSQQYQAWLYQRLQMLVLKCGSNEPNIQIPPIVTLNIMYDLHNVINVSVDLSHVLILSYYLVKQ